MRILFLPKYPKLGASSRLRTYQFLPLWIAAGKKVKVSSFFNEAYLTRFYKGKKHDPLNVLSCYVRRFWVLLSVGRYDLVCIEKELFPFLPPVAEWCLARLGKGYVVDYDDAVFHNYDSHPRALIRHLLGKKIAQVMRYSKVVFAGNEYLKSYALKAGANRVEILPTVVQLSKYPLKKTKPSLRLSIGWVGSPTTMKYLMTLESVFRKLALSYPLELIVINAKDTALTEMGIPLRLIPWTEEEEGERIAEMDIGIMPLPDDKWEQGKCAYKLIQYMACGLPVVASPVGMNQEVVKHGENGFLADSEAEWIFYLETLIQDATLRSRMGNAGRTLVQSEYTLERNFGKMVGVLGKKGKGNRD